MKRPSNSGVFICNMLYLSIPGFNMKRNIAIIENNIISTLTVRSKLTKVLIEQGHQVTILTTGTEQQLQKAKDQGFDVIDIHTSSQNPADILRRKFWKRIFLWKLMKP